MSDLFEKLAGDPLLQSVLISWAFLVLLFSVTLILLLSYRRRGMKEERSLKELATQYDALPSDDELWREEDIRSGFGGRNLASLRMLLEQLAEDSDERTYRRITRMADLSGLRTSLLKSAAVRRNWKRAMALHTLAVVADSRDLELFRDVLRNDSFRPAFGAAAYGLARLRDISSVRTILDRVYTPERPNRDMLIAVLAVYDSVAADELIAVLEEGNHDELVQCAIADLLGFWRYRPASSILEKILSRTDHTETKIHFMEALEKTGRDSCCARVEELLEDPDMRVRLKAVNTLEQIAGNRYMPQVEKMLYDDVLMVRRNAAEALRRMGDEGRDRVKQLHKSDDKRVAYITALVSEEERFGRMRWRYRFAKSLP